MPLVHPSITKLIEYDIVANTLADSHYRNTLLNV
jgi:hypothetical protein